MEQGIGTIPVSGEFEWTQIGEKFLCKVAMRAYSNPYLT